VFSDEPLELFECDKATGEVAKPAFLNSEIGELTAAADRAQRQKELARLVISPENARLRRTIVNRLWARFFGRGLIEPIDEIDNPAWNENLLEWLANDMQAHGDDMKHVMEQILTSRAYQMVSVDGEPTDRDFVFRGPLVKRLTAEQFVDSIWMITGTGPEKADAQVGPAAGGTGGAPPFGRWIWSYADASTPKPKAGEQITLRKRVQLDGAPQQAKGVMMSVERIDLGKALQAGENELIVLARNLGDSPNPAGLFFAAEIQLDGEQVVRLATDESWEWTSTAPDGNGSMPSSDVTWKSAAVLANQGFLGKSVNQQIAQVMAKLSGGPEPKQEFIRAALVVADPLMRALGRPNREQVVTTRPDLLTTLEALDLTNGAALAALLERSASNLLAMHPDWTTQDAIEFTYQSFLNRSPTPAEREVAQEIVGQTPSAASLSDLLWTVLMLPDFQLIR
jgi:hypothetical protein